MSLCKPLARACLILLSAVYLAACSSSQPQTGTGGGVQDIAPGEQSIIQPPATSAAPASNIRERRL